MLVSAETVRDYQLRAGDRLTLRLASTGGALVAVPFHYAGIANEFPTAPKDSFLVANAGYIAHTTGNDAVGSFLVTASDPPPAVAQRLRAALGRDPDPP